MREHRNGGDEVPDHIKHAEDINRLRDDVYELSSLTSQGLADFKEGCCCITKINAKRTTVVGEREDDSRSGSTYSHGST